jgi:hypothetical protein
MVAAGGVRGASTSSSLSSSSAAAALIHRTGADEDGAIGSVLRGDDSMGVEPARGTEASAGRAEPGVFTDLETSDRFNNLPWTAAFVILF